MPCEAQPQARVSLKSTCSLPLLAYVVTFQAGHAGSIPATRFTKTRSLRRFTGPFLPARHLVTHATARAWERRVQSNTPKGDAHEAPSAHRGVRARNARRCRIGNCGPVRRQHDPGWPRRTSGRHVRTRAAVRRRDHCRERPDAAVPEPAGPGDLGGSTCRPWRVLGDGGQRLRHQGELRGLPPPGVPRDAALRQYLADPGPRPGRRLGRGLHLPPRSRPTRSSGRS